MLESSKSQKNLDPMSVIRDPAASHFEISTLVSERWIHSAREARGWWDDHGTNESGMFGAQEMRLLARPDPIHDPIH